VIEAKADMANHEECLLAVAKEGNAEVFQGRYSLHAARVRQHLILGPIASERGNLPLPAGRRK